MSAYFELVPCVPVGLQAGASGGLQTEEWVDKPPGPQSHDNAILGQGSVVEHQACGSLLCSYSRLTLKLLCQ